MFSSREGIVPKVRVAKEVRLDRLRFDGNLLRKTAGLDAIGQRAQERQLARKPSVHKDELMAHARHPVGFQLRL